ncbi:MAG: nucleotidyltransferase family protein, partial [Elusimicrobia bacterium]|nr:nucleotidyltransferase family protein [Elusimicrobiota bacterium]
HANTIAKNKNQIIDVHYSIVKSNKNSDKKYKEIFERAKKYNFYGLTVLIPKIEDFLFLLFNNGFDNIIYSQPFYKNVSWFLDGMYIIKNNKNIDWNILIQNAKETETLAQIKIMLELFDSFLPNVIPNNIISSIKISKEEQKNFNFYTKTHLAFSKAQQLKREITKCKHFSNKIKLFSQFLYLKIIQKTPIINTLFFDKTASRIFKI